MKKEINMEKEINMKKEMNMKKEINMKKELNMKKEIYMKKKFAFPILPVIPSLVFHFSLYQFFRPLLTTACSI